MKLNCARLCFIILLFFITLQLFSQVQGVVLEEETLRPSLFGSSGNRSKTTTWIAGERVRRDEEASNQTTIIRPDLGKIWMIQHGDTTYREVNRELFQGLAIMGLMMFGVTTDTLTGKPIIPDPFGSCSVFKRPKMESRACRISFMPSAMSLAAFIL